MIDKTNMNHKGSVIIRARKSFPLFNTFTLNIFTFIIISFLSQPKIAAGENADILFASGLKEYNSFSDTGIKLSLELFEDAIKERPDFSAAHSALSDSYIQTYYRSKKPGKALLERAFKLSERALLLDAKSPVAHKSLGTVYFASGKTENAIEEFERAVDMEPNYARAWLNLGSCYHKMGDIKRAISHFTRAIELKNDTLAEGLGNYNIAAISYEKGDFSKALKHYETAKKILPSYHNIYYGAGITLIQLGRDKEAVVFFKEAINLKPDDADFYFGLGAAHNRLGNESEAQFAYESALDIDPDMDDARQSLMRLKGFNIGTVETY